jgi:hypothetical protein
MRTWRCTGAPVIRLFEAGRTYLAFPGRTRGLQVHLDNDRCARGIAGAPGDARCALGMPGAPGIRFFEAGCTCHSQGAPLDRRCVDFDNARRILGMLGAPWAKAGPGSLDLCSRSVDAPLAAPQNGTPARVLGGVSPLACALRCWAFGSFGRPGTRGDAPELSAKECGSPPAVRFPTSLSSQSSSYVRRALPPFVMLVEGQLLARHEGRASSTGHRSVGRWWILTCDCGVRRWCVKTQQKNCFEIICHLNLLPTYLTPPSSAIYLHCLDMQAMHLFAVANCLSSRRIVASLLIYAYLNKR